jgi:hypothetical protein
VLNGFVDFKSWNAMMIRKWMAVAWTFVLLSGAVFAQNLTTSELLQKGIYLQETVGDLDGAIKAYREVVQKAAESRANAAQAEYRLGICLQKKGQQSEAVETFKKLMKEYPDQAELVARARELVPAEARVADLKLLPAPWADGEVLAFTTKQQDSSIGRSWYSFQSSKTHRGGWVFDARGHHDSSMFWQLLFGRVEVDGETMRPIGTLGTRLYGYNYQVSYKPRMAEMTDNDGKNVSQVAVPSQVFDSVELVALLRRLPWADGYKTTLTLLGSGGTGGLVTLEFAVAAEEVVQTPAGAFHCYRIESRVPTKPGSVGEKYWITTDAARVPVKFDFRGSITELAALPGHDTEESVYTDEGSGASFTVPAGWTVTDWHLEGTRFTGRIYNLHSAGIVYLGIVSCRCPSTASTQGDKYSGLRSRGYGVRWTDPSGIHWSASRITVTSSGSQANISLNADTKTFDSLQPSFDAIVNSFVLR